MLPLLRYQGNPRKWCSEACRQKAYRAGQTPSDRAERLSKSRTYAAARRVPVVHDLKCQLCGQRFNQSRPATRCARCRAAPYRIECPCGAVVMRKNAQMHCSISCAKRFKPARVALDEQDRKARRRARERAAPGLTQHQRTRLLARWRAQGRVCWACHARPAATVDHLVPLFRGGTNYEGNLAPACRPCNARRGHKLVVEWLHGVRVRQVQDMAATLVA